VLELKEKDKKVYYYTATEVNKRRGDILVGDVKLHRINLHPCLFLREKLLNSVFLYRKIKPHSRRSGGKATSKSKSAYLSRMRSPWIFFFLPKCTTKETVSQSNSDIFSSSFNKVIHFQEGKV
jgi:hypothetical protein